MSVPGPWMWTSSLPSIHSARRLTSSDWRCQAVTGSASVGQAGRVVEVLVVAQRHPRLARVGVRREQRERPAVLAGGGALHRGLHQRLARLLRARLLLRVGLRELARVRRRPSSRSARRRSRPPTRRSAGPSRAARRTASSKKAAWAPSVVSCMIGRPARAQHLLVDRLHQRLGGGRATGSRRRRPSRTRVE